MGIVDQKLSAFILRNAVFEADTRAEFQRIEEHFQHINGTIREHGGKILLLEGRNVQQDLKDATAAGLLAGRGEALITRAQWKTILLLIGGMGTVAGAVSSVIVLIANSQ